MDWDILNGFKKTFSELTAKYNIDPALEQQFIKKGGTKEELNQRIDPPKQSWLGRAIDQSRPPGYEKKAQPAPVQQPDKVEVVEPEIKQPDKVEVVEPEIKQPDKVEVVEPDFKIASVKSKYPENTGNMDPVPVQRKIKRDGVVVTVDMDANNVQSLTETYLVRPEKQKQYGGPIRSIGNIDLETVPYATRPTHIQEIKDIYNLIGNSPRVGKPIKDFDYFDMQKEFAELPGNVPSPLQHISGQIAELLEHYGVTPGEFVAVVRKDSGAGTKGPGDRAYDNKNPGNVNNTDNGTDTYLDTWIEGCAAAIRNLAERKVL